MLVVVRLAAALVLILTSFASAQSSLLPGLDLEMYGWELSKMPYNTLAESESYDFPYSAYKFVWVEEDFDKACLSVEHFVWHRSVAPYVEQIDVVHAFVLFQAYFEHRFLRLFLDHGIYIEASSRTRPFSLGLEYAFDASRTIFLTYQGPIVRENDNSNVFHALSICVAV